MLQLAVTAHVEVANEVVLVDSSLLHALIRLDWVPASVEGLEDTDFADVSQWACRPLYNQLAPPSSLMNPHLFTRSPRRRARAGAVAHRDHRFGGFELVYPLLAMDHAHTLLGTACISSASAALKLRSPGTAPL